MPNYTFQCASGHSRDAVRPRSVAVVPCLECGEEARRISIYRLVSKEPDIRYAGRDFEEASEMLASQRAEFEKREGVAPRTPDLWRAATARANRLKALGAKSSRDL